MNEIYVHEPQTQKPHVRIQQKAQKVLMKAQFSFGGELHLS